MTCIMLLFATELILMRSFENFRYFSFWFQYHKSCKSNLHMQNAFTAYDIETMIFTVYYMQQKDAESFDHFKSTVVLLDAFLN